jgi:hypothetical protein
VNSIRRLLQTAFLIVTASVTVVAQQPGAMATLGAIRVPECIPAPDAEYGLTPNKPIEIGGGPSSAQARMSRYFGALRGPQGQMLQFTRKSFGSPLRCTSILTTSVCPRFQKVSRAEARWSRLSVSRRWIRRRRVPVS